MSFFNSSMDVVKKDPCILKTLIYGTYENLKNEENTWEFFLSRLSYSV